MSNNGNGNGNGNNIHNRGNQYRRLETMLDEKRFEVMAIEATLRMLDGRAQQSATVRAKTTFDQAVELDAARRAATGGALRKKTKKAKKLRGSGHGGLSTMTIRQQRQALLDEFDLQTPREAPTGMAPGFIRSLKRFGYIKQRGSKGFVRTGKNFVDATQ